jgi:preprotein translocase subunit SecF
VVFDRIRENTARRAARDLEGIVNISILETLGRNLNSNITTLLALTAIFILGGGTLQSLLLSLLIGITAGAYDAICIAPLLLVVWERGEWLGPLRRRRAAAPSPAQPFG